MNGGNVVEAFAVSGNALEAGALLAHVLEQRRRLVDGDLCRSGDLFRRGRLRRDVHAKLARFLRDEQAEHFHKRRRRSSVQETGRRES